MPKQDSTNPKRPKRIPERVKLSDSSCAPGLGLCERIAHNRKPSREDLAILDAWKFRFPVTISS